MVIRLEIRGESKIGGSGLDRRVAVIVWRHRSGEGRDLTHRLWRWRCRSSFPNGAPANRADDVGNARFEMYEGVKVVNGVRVVKSDIAEDDAGRWPVGSG